jgi:hypothetical protein
MKAGAVKKIDYEYERKGVASVFVAFDCLLVTQSNIKKFDRDCFFWYFNFDESFLRAT